MKRAVLATILASVCAVPVWADPVQEQLMGSSQIVLQSSFPLHGGTGGIEAFDPNDRYSNVNNFTATIANQGPVGPGDATSTGITRMLMDDIHAISNTVIVGDGSSSAANSITVNLGNANTVAVAARLRVRFWANDGAGGGPGTLLGLFSSVGNINCNANTACLIRFAGFAAPITLGQDFWSGIAYDNGGTADAGGVPNATAAQLANIGMATWDPPEIGSSQDRDFLTTGTTTNGFNGVNNPAGAIRIAPFGATNKANYGFDFGPEPTSICLLAFGALMLRRRR